MDVLTADELEVLNNASRVLLSTVRLGDLVQDLAARAGEEVTPVNAVAASLDFTLSGVVIDGETLSLGADIYEMLADAVQSKADPGNLAIDITSYVTGSTVTLTIDTQVLSADTMTVEGVIYTFVPNGTANAEGEIGVGTDLASCQDAIVDAINGVDGVNTKHPLVSAGAFGGNDSVFTVDVGGVAGDAYESTENFDEVTNVFSATTFGSGADCSAANAVTAIVAAITALDTEGVGAVDGTGDVVELLAEVAGVAANLIAVETTCANGTFAGAATELEGGIDGTVAFAGTIRVDASYLYLPLADNTVADANWCRLAISTF